MKRFLVLLILALFLFAFFTSCNRAEPQENENQTDDSNPTDQIPVDFSVDPHLRFRFGLNDQTCTVIGYEGDSDTVIIPEYYGDFVVKAIDEFAFENCGTTLERIVIPKKIKIWDFAFYGCDSLKEVYYGGTESDWETYIYPWFENESFILATRYYYSEAVPAEEGNYWHYVDGVPTRW